MQHNEFLHQYDSKINGLVWWYCFWFIGSSYESLNNTAERFMAEGEMYKHKYICMVIAMKQLYDRLSKE